MHGASLTLTDDRFEFVGDLEFDFNIPPAPTNDVIQLIQEIEDGVREPVIKLRPYKWVVADPENVNLFIAIRFMRLSVVRVEMVEMHEPTKAPRKRVTGRLLDNLPPLEAVAVPPMTPEPEFFEDEDPFEGDED